MRSCYRRKGGDPRSLGLLPKPDRSPQLCKSSGMSGPLRMLLARPRPVPGAMCPRFPGGSPQRPLSGASAVCVAPGEGQLAGVTGRRSGSGANALAPCGTLTCQLCHPPLQDVGGDVRPAASMQGPPFLPPGPPRGPLLLGATKRPPDIWHLQGSRLQSWHQEDGMALEVLFRPLEEMPKNVFFASSWHHLLVPIAASC